MHAGCPGASILDFMILGVSLTPNFNFHEMLIKIFLRNGQRFFHRIFGFVGSGGPHKMKS